MPRRSRELSDRFWERVDIREPDQCWEWTAGKSGDGYGAIRNEVGKNEGAHRVAFRLANGTIPENMIVCHACDNPTCVNPGHLWLGTTADNMHDRDKKGRHVPSRGECNGSAILTRNDVIEMREIMGKNLLTDRAAAELYGISRRHACQIRRRVRWAHV